MRAITRKSFQLKFSWMSAFAAIAMMSATDLHAAVISNYAFDGNPASAAVTVAPAGATFSDFTRIGLDDESHPDTFRTSGFSTDPSVDLAQYEGFTVNASGALSLAFEALSFDHNRSGKGPETGEVSYSFDGFASVTGSLIWDIATGNTTRIWDFTDFVLNPGDTVEFRFYGYNADEGSGSKFFELDNVGFVEGASIPEPASVLLAGLGLVMGVGGRYLTRRRKRMAA